MCTEKKNFHRSYVPTKAKNTANVLAIHSKERVYTVNSGASLFLMGLSSSINTEKKTVQTVSDKQAKACIKELGAYLFVHLVDDSLSVLLLGRLCIELCDAFSWTSGETPRLSKGEKMIACCIENFVPVVAVTKQEAVPPIQFLSVKGIFKREKEVKDTMLDL